MIVNLTELHQLKEKFLHDNKFKLPFNIEPITHHHIASYVALFISIFIIIFIAYKKFKECRTRQPSNQPKDVNDVPFSINIRDCWINYSTAGRMFMIMCTVLAVGAHLSLLFFIVSWRSTCSKQLKITGIYWYAIPRHAHVLISMSLCVGTQQVLFRSFAENPLMSTQATLAMLSCRYMSPYACLIALVPFLLLLSAAC